jgi:cell wall-active antibiotic response 4TMS protein YvqF
MSGRGFSWPLVLIAIGIIFLLANFGVIPGVSPLGLLNLWPLLLILAGVDIAAGRRWPLAALGIDIAVIALGLALLVTQPTFAGGPFFGIGTAAGGQRDVSVARQSATTSLSLDINGGAGRFRFGGGSAALVEAHSTNDDLVLRRSNFDSGGEHADVRIDENTRRFGSASGAADVETRVASDVSTTLSVNGGAGEFIIDLRDVKLRGADLNVGAASLILTLPKPTAMVTIDVNAGASSIVVEVPDGVEAQISTKGALLTLRSSNARVNASGNSAETSGYPSATARVNVRITAGVSSITIR